MRRPAHPPETASSWCVCEPAALACRRPRRVSGKVGRTRVLRCRHCPASPASRQVVLARYYDPATGQFLTRDPITALTQAPYSYAADDPLNLTDPTGLFWGEGTLKKVGHFVVQHRGAIANVVAGAVCVGTVGTGCLVAAGIAAGVNAEQTAQNGGSLGDVGLSVLKSAAFAIPGIAESAAEETEVEALSMMTRLDISTEGWAEPAWLKYGFRAFYEGAVAIPDFRELYAALFGAGVGCR